MLTKYSEVLPDGSLTPPPKTVVEVLWTWGVDDLECEAEDVVKDEDDIEAGYATLPEDIIPPEDVNPPFRTVLPCNQDVIEDECVNHVIQGINTRWLILLIIQGPHKYHILRSTY